MGASLNKRMSTYHKRKLWESYYYKEGKRFSLGYYTSKESAEAASEARQGLPEGAFIHKRKPTIGLRCAQSSPLIDDSEKEIKQS